MVASRAARERKAAADAGPLARVAITVGDDDAFVYKLNCVRCNVPDRGYWSTYRNGADNGYLAAMDRWIFHLHEKHRDQEAPCLTYLPAAQQRLHERRLAQEADQGD
ncbi:hypothetical protein NODU109028_17785 [Nocardioides dubius]|uniref:Uncharacterized protein n=1 Tax=Nocardioides dubius TaxID=317019 RepID=A0ABN1U482_9ACTN